jgi:hypothetical protein
VLTFETAKVEEMAYPLPDINLNASYFCFSNREIARRGSQLCSDSTYVGNTSRIETPKIREFRVNYLDDDIARRCRSAY